LGSRAAIAVLTLLLVVASQGCGMNKSREGPPFEPGNLKGPRSLLITNSDIDGVGALKPYGALLLWWQALQRGDVAQVKRSYAGRVTTREAKREIHGFKPPFSQPINPTVQTPGKRALVRAVVRTATRRKDIPSVVRVTEAPVSFSFVRKGTRWRLRRDSYEHYARSRGNQHLAAQG
jgi:hypothetical protein